MREFCCLSMVDGRSPMRSDICLLNGELWLSWDRPRNEPCRSSRCGAACGRSMANGFTTGFTGTGGSRKKGAIIYNAEMFGDGGSLKVKLPAGLHSCGSCRRSVNGVARKLPVRVNVELDESKFIVTLHSLSRFCFRSRQTANAQPTAWLNLSP